MQGQNAVKDGIRENIKLQEDCLEFTGEVCEKNFSTSKMESIASPQGVVVGLMERKIMVVLRLLYGT